ncbi:L-rhamnose mutarotase [Gryllotalpicola ginsengisoli]|uniref:L-rhamnose mutarotase n=1 Tax=Gryllotalpicola ginsengisoli TaxID=444608 RepID=UPI0003B3587F|nr:L-rhamnose mutarotase [Gryllotalpicola ginsengisoli]
MTLRICFTLRVRPDRIDEYRARHASVWPDMLQAIEASGRRNYSIFLADDGQLVGYYEVTDAAAKAAADEYLAASPVAARWEAEMAEFFVDLDGRADQAAVELEEIFNLDEQLEAAEGAGDDDDVL